MTTVEKTIHYEPDEEEVLTHEETTRRGTKIDTSKQVRESIVQFWIDRFNHYRPTS